MSAFSYPVTIAVAVLMIGFGLFLYWTGRRIRANNAKSAEVDWEGVRVIANGRYFQGPDYDVRVRGRVTQKNAPLEYWYPAWLVDVDGSTDRLWFKAESLKREPFLWYCFRREGFGKTSWRQIGFLEAILFVALAVVVTAGEPLGWWAGTFVVVHSILFYGTWRNFNNKQA